jgi:hypothetical protein
MKHKIVVKEESRLMRVVGVLLRFTTPDFMSSYATTIANTVYIPRAWIEAGRVEKVLEHELVHVRQWQRGWILFWFLYALPWKRALLELEAYEEDFKRWAKTNGGKVPAHQIEWVTNVLTDSRYVWAWPFPKSALRRRVEAAVRRVEQNHA